MNLLSIRIITTDVDRLTRFYERVTGLAAKRHTDDFAELNTSVGTLAIGNVRTLPLFGDNHGVEPAANRSAIIEFRVDNIEGIFRHIEQELGSAAIVQAPTTMPWGNRSLLVRDPDGNLVNFFQPVSAEAIARFKRT